MKSQPEIICTECGWTGMNSGLTTPNQILDDDRPDYGGHCPQCDAHTDSGSIIDIEDTESSIALGLPVKPTQVIFKAVAIPLLAIALFAIGKGDTTTFLVFTLPALGLYLGAWNLPEDTAAGRQERALLIPVALTLMSLVISVITS